MILTIPFLLYLLQLTATVDVDSKGYVMYCPCMGRFGNQIDQTLGAIAFARAIDRTLVLPPFVDYAEISKANMVPFEDLFQVKVLSRYLKVITQKEFMREIAPTVWPKENRKALCWSARQSYFDSAAPSGCHAKEGNPFGPFWDHSNIDFVGDEYFGDIQGGFELSSASSRKEWQERFPPATHPVLAFSSAPGSFPSRSRNWNIQKYLRWNSRIVTKAKNFINSTLERPFVGIHLRNNVDWESVCKHVAPDRKENIFASAQCLGEPMVENFNEEMCMPNTKTVIEAVAEKVGQIGAKSVFVTSDKDHMLPELNDVLKAYDVKAFRLPTEDVHVALAILQYSDHFIGNCISTFSSVVTRDREHSIGGPRPSSFFGFNSKESFSHRRKIDL